MTCREAPACRAVLTQATERWSDRRTSSDGICASPKHTTENPGSDHEPHVLAQGVGYATAVDLSDDKAHGCDADAWADRLVARRDPRVKYLIRNREMVSSYPAHGVPAWTWRAYTGPNPHETHTHLSIVPAAIFDTSPWFPEEDDMDAKQNAELLEIGRLVRGMNHQIVVPGVGLQAVLAAVKATPTAGMDTRALAASIASALDDDLAAAVADVLAARLTG